MSAIDTDLAMQMAQQVHFTTLLEQGFNPIDFLLSEERRREGQVEKQRATNLQEFKIWLEEEDNQTNKMIHEIMERRFSELQLEVDRLNRRLEALATRESSLKKEASSRVKLLQEQVNLIQKLNESLSNSIAALNKQSPLPSYASILSQLGANMSHYVAHTTHKTS